MSDESNATSHADPGAAAPFPAKQASLRAAAGWVTVLTAATILGLTPTALRKQLERKAREVADGGTEASLDVGIRGRKIGRQWRLQLSEAWLGSGVR